jgi:hypothetical protein
LIRPSGIAAPASPRAPLAARPSAAGWSLAELIESRGLAWTLLLCGAAQATLVSAGWPGWPCPVQQGLGLPCPGCGLSRALAALLRGEWQAALAIHPFVFLLLLFFAFVAVGALAPAALARKVAATLRVVEKRTRFTFVITTAFLVYGLLRLLVVAVPFVGRALV